MMRAELYRPVHVSFLARFKLSVSPSTIEFTALPLRVDNACAENIGA